MAKKEKTEVGKRSCVYWQKPRFSLALYQKTVSIKEGPAIATLWSSSLGTSLVLTGAQREVKAEMDGTGPGAVNPNSLAAQRS